MVEIIRHLGEWSIYGRNSKDMRMFVTPHPTFVSKDATTVWYYPISFDSGRRLIIHCLREQREDGTMSSIMKK